MQVYLFLDKITIFNFVIILYFYLRYRSLKIVCGSLPSKRFFYHRLEKYLLRHCNITFISYQHLDLYGINIPKKLIDNFGELKDNINERSYICCEKLFNQKIIKLRSYKNILRFVDGNERINNFVKKELLINYCKKYINLFECANFFISESSEDFNLFLILTGDSLNIWDIYYHEFKSFTILPKVSFKRYFHLVDRLSSSLAGLFVLTLILYQSIKRLSFSMIKQKNNKKTIWITSGFDFNLLPNLFKETSHFDSSFFAEQALVVFEEPEATGHIEKFCCDHRIESVMLARTPIPFSYFTKRILRNMCGLFLGKQILLSFLGKGKLFLWKINYSFIKNMIDYESLCELYPVSLFLTGRFYEQKNSIKTIVINKYGGKTISFQFGDIVHPMFHAFLYAYCTANYFFLYGEGTGEFQKCSHFIDEYYITGSHRVDLFPQLKENREFLRKKFQLNDSFVITVFGPAYNETLPRKRNVLKFYHAVFSAFLEVIEQDVKLVIKMHKKKFMAEEERDFPELASLMNLFRNHAKVRYYSYKNPYELMVATDFVITWSASATGIESITAGKKTIYFDPMESRFHPYRIYHDKLVVSNENELKKLVKLAIENKFPITEEIYERIRHKHCYLNDGQSTQRILDKLYKIKQ